MKSNINISISNWKTIQNQTYDIVILPWGATEPHNYHLPYGTDTILSEAIASLAVEKAMTKGVNCMVLPAVPFGTQNPGQIEYPFCIHTRAETQKAILHDIVFSLYHQGFRKLLIINGHGGNNFKNFVRDLAVDFPDFCIVTADWYTVENDTEVFDNPGEHAGELETSVMMHFHPEWVLSLDEAGVGDIKPFVISALNNKKLWLPRNWKQVSEDTGIGNPKKSSAVKGKIFAEKVTDTLSEFICDFAHTNIDGFYEK